MQNLLSREEYDKDETGYWKRIPIVAGTAFGISMAIAGYFILERTPNLLHPPTLREILLIGILSGIFFGALFPWTFRRKSRQMIDRLYAGDERLITTPSAEDSFDYRFPCTWVKSSLGVGGVLYVGSSGLLFVPHRFNSPSVSAFRMTPLEDLHVGLSETPRSLSPLQRMLVPHPQPLMEIQWTSGSACFLVPSAAMTVDRLAQVLRNLKSRAGQHRSF